MTEPAQIVSRQQSPRLHARAVCRIMKRDPQPQNTTIGQPGRSHSAFLELKHHRVAHSTCCSWDSHMRGLLEERDLLVMKAAELHKSEGSLKTQDRWLVRIPSLQHSARCNRTFRMLRLLMRRFGGTVVEGPAVDTTELYKLRVWVLGATTQASASRWRSTVGAASTPLCAMCTTLDFMPRQEASCNQKINIFCGCAVFPVHCAVQGSSEDWARRMLA